MKPLTPAKTMCQTGTFLTETPPIASLKHIFRPFFPDLRSGSGRPISAETPPTAVQEPPAKSKLLAVVK